MKYQQPYGVSDPNAAYINGNPTTGQMGSIPPAASIEYPQREIVNLIGDCGFAASDADLHQLAKGVQGRRMNYALDAGVKNSYVTSVTPILSAYVAGQQWCILILNTNDGASTLNINGLGARPVVYPSGGQLKGNELLQGAVVTLVYDGTNFQLQNAVSNMLAAPKQYYVNAAIGSDTAYDGLTPTVTGGHGPFATHQHALNMSLLWNMNGFSIDIYTADGAYPPFFCERINGSGWIGVHGNNANPAGVLIHSTAGEAIMVSADNYRINGMKVVADTNGPAPHVGAGVRVSQGYVELNFMEFGACFYAHCFVHAGASMAVGGDIPTLSQRMRISGNSPMHIYASANAVVYWDNQIFVDGPLNIGTWIEADTGASVTYRPAAQTITGVVTGKKFESLLNAIIATGGGVNYLPGTIPGNTATGGQYT